MKRTLLIVTFTCILFFISLNSFSPAGNAGIVGDILIHTNQFRKSKSLEVLIMQHDLNAIAQKHSADMASERVGFGHGGFEKRTILAGKKIRSMHSFAENVAYGATSGKQAVTIWKNSSGHRRNMLGRFKYIGIGVAKDKRGRIYYTQIFAG